VRWGEVGEEMSDDLIKRDDALAAIAAFKRDFEQPWKVQFSADIKALPAVDLSERIEELERGMDALQDRLDTANKARADANFWANENQFKLAKAVEIGNKMAASIKGNYYIPNVVAEWNAVLAELEKAK
jgi:hypothetical protein